MPRSARHLAMLEAMGLRVFEPLAKGMAPPVEAPGAAVASSSAHAASPRLSSTSDRAHSPMPQRARVATRPEDERVAAMAWPALREAVNHCRACGLCESRTQTVFGVGHERAHWMIVGEAPGEQEDLQGEPFVGESGRLLDKMLHALMLTRSQANAAQQVYIANTLKCRPPRNRNPAPEELAKCEPFLLRQIELVQPKVILAMGRFAVQSLLRTDDAIGRLRGRVHRYEGRPLVVTYHPAYLLRNPIDKARAWEDLCLAASVVDSNSSTKA